MRVLVLALCLTFISYGCVTLKPISGGIFLPNGKYIINEQGNIQLEFLRAGVGTQLGQVEIIIRNISSEALEIDYTKTIILADSGEQLEALDPKTASTSISASQEMAQSMAGDIIRNGIGKATIQPKGFIKGSFYFQVPSQPYNHLHFTFKGIPDSPELIIGSGRNIAPASR